MKALIVISFLLCSIITGYSQEVTELEELHISSLPEQLESTAPNEYRFIINEKYAGEFTKDPIAFMKANFDINAFIASVQEKNYETYQLVFNSSKGFLRVDFDREGELMSTSQRFKDIVLPLDVRRDLYNNNKGWSMTKNTYVARGTGDLVDKELYRIKMEKGKDRKTVKIDPKQITSSVASN